MTEAVITLPVTPGKTYAPGAVVGYAASLPTGDETFYVFARATLSSAAAMTGKFDLLFMQRPFEGPVEDREELHVMDFLKSRFELLLWEQTDGVYGASTNVPAPLPPDVCAVVRVREAATFAADTVTLAVDVAPYEADAA